MVPEGNVTPAPEPGPAKVTFTPETGLPYWSVTIAARELLKVVPTVADCPPPEATAILAADPALTVTVAVPVADVKEVSVTVIVSDPAVLSITLLNV